MFFEFYGEYLIHTYMLSVFFSGVRLLWDGVSFLEMTVPSKFQDQLCGLCGNFNGDPADDFVGKRGGSYVSGQDFGSSWRVGGLRACSILPKDMPEHYQVKAIYSSSPDLDTMAKRNPALLHEKEGVV